MAATSITREGLQGKTNAALTNLTTTIHATIDALFATENADGPINLALLAAANDGLYTAYLEIDLSLYTNDTELNIAKAYLAEKLTDAEGMNLTVIRIIRQANNNYIYVVSWKD